MLELGWYSKREPGSQLSRQRAKRARSASRLAQSRGPEGALREARGVGEELLDADGVLPVRAELGEHVGHALVEAELALLRGAATRPPT